jgi:hypothetical protein
MHPLGRVPTVLNACRLFDRPLLDGQAISKGGNNDGGTGGGDRSWIARRIGMVLPSPPKQRCDSNKGGRRVKVEATKRAIAAGMRVASNDNGNGNGGKSNGDSNKDGGQVTMRAMGATTTVAGDDKGNDNSNG